MEPIYVVLIINLIVWSGIFGYTFFTNKQINQLKVKIDSIEKSNKK